MVCVGCGAGPEVRNLQVVSTVHDTKSKSTRVLLSFEVWNDGEQVEDLPVSAFQVFEDGQAATSESLSEASTGQTRVPVALLLDTSLSMYEAGAIASLKSAAATFRDSLEKSGYEVHAYSFATEVKALEQIEDIPDEFDDEAGRWTSLYAALRDAFANHQPGIVVVFSDGADNYSQNHGVPGLDAVAAFVRPPEEGGNGREETVHAIAFGNASTERDKAGVPAMRALTVLSRNGSLNTAASKDAFVGIFDDVASRLRNVHLLEYFSPSITGSHSIEVEVTVDDSSVRSSLVNFSAPSAEDRKTSAFQDLREQRAEAASKFEKGQKVDCEGWSKRPDRGTVIGVTEYNMLRVRGERSGLPGRYDPTRCRHVPSDASAPPKK